MGLSSSVYYHASTSDLGRAEFAAADEGAALRLLMLGSSATAHEGVQCDKNVSQV